MAALIKYIPTPAAYKPQEVLPGLFKPTAKQQGRIHRVDYITSGAPKHAYVYAPYGYDNTKKYDVLYLMHGGGDRADRFIGTDDTPNEFKCTLDHMIENGDIRPILVVSPSFYPMEEKLDTLGRAGELVAIFHKELMNDLIPAVETAFSTYAESVDLPGLKASRSHRAFGGFSMGACATWWQLLRSLDVISTFLPLSGDCWLLGERGCATKPVETVETMAELLKQSGWTKENFRIFAATGTKDIAFDALNSQIKAMKEHPEIFAFGETLSEGNLHYILADGLEHRWEPIWDYCYDILCLLYPTDDQ
jgi:enterochelin esterase-like enzyme